MIASDNILSGLPSNLRKPLLKAYREIAANYTENRWEPAELNGGKFCEVVYSIVYGAIVGSFPASVSKPQKMVEACRALEGAAVSSTRVGDRSLRILIPRMLPVLYEIRNNRGVGHVGGDVDPNLLDATAVVGMASWVLAELVRIFHGVNIEQAQDAVNTLVERKHPLVWEIGGTKRVLDASMTAKNQVLLLVYRHTGWVSESDLFKWTEYSNASAFRSNVLRPLHKARMIEYVENSGQVHISPLGITEVEEEVLRSRSS